jgi:hypothetical protein
MDSAKCILDNKIYTALEFSKLAPGELSTKRKYLVCIECQAVAFFRKASRNGQAAYFGAFPHVKDCLFARSDTQRLKLENFTSGAAQDLNVSNNLYLANTPQPYIGAGLAIDKKLSHQENIPFSVEDLKSGPLIHRALGTKLKSLIFSEKYGEPSHDVGIKEESTPILNHYFASFKSIKPEWTGEIRGYCGMLTDARLSSEGALWLNTGDIGKVSCVIQANMVDTFFRRYTLEDEEDLAGAYVIIIGASQVSSNGKIYIKLVDIDYIDLIRIVPLLTRFDQFFLTDKSKKAFLLTHNETSVFDEELGIKRKHYIDKDIAKEWRAKFANEFHPDKNQGDTLMDYDQILSCINKIYNRMVGKA